MLCSTNRRQAAINTSTGAGVSSMKQPPHFRANHISDPAGSRPTQRETVQAHLGPFPPARVYMSQPAMRPKVLIADDEKIIADTLAMILNLGGFEARAVYTSRNALELALVFQPDMLISDVLMTEINGVEAAIQMRAMLPDVRVFLLSGQTATADLIAESKAGDLGFEVLVKPVHPRDLLTKLLSAAPLKTAA